MKKIRRLKRTPKTSKVYFIDPQSSDDDLLINGKQPVGLCPYCKRELYAGDRHRVCNYYSTPCGYCGKIIVFQFPNLKKIRNLNKHKL
jgi:hypothetical protein